MTTHHASPARVIGAYAIQPAAPDERPDFIRRVLALPGCDGLEVSVGTPAYAHDQEWLWDVMATGGRHVLTLIGGEMDRYQLDPTFGLASSETSGRRAALDLLRQVRDEVERRTQSREQTIVAVEVHSFPTVDTRGARASADRLTESLVEASRWDWCGAALVVEHCDARTVEHPWQKGLLPIALEIEAVSAVRRVAPAARVGVSINWGRSVIETRDLDGPEQHALLAQEAGVLSGLMISGASDRTSAYGDAWADAHLPLSPCPGADQFGEPTSLLTAVRVRSTLAVAGPDELIFDGVKVSTRPLDRSSRDRIALLGWILSAMGKSVDRVPRDLG